MTDSMEAIRLKRAQAKARKSAADTADTDSPASAAENNNDEQSIMTAPAEEQPRSLTTDETQAVKKQCTSEAEQPAAEAQTAKKTRKKPSDTVKISASGEKIYTPTQAAAILQTTPQTIHAWIKNGKITAIKFGPRGASHITETEMNRLRVKWNII